MARRLDLSAASGVIVATSVIAAVGLVDAVRQSEPALGVLFAMIVVLNTAQLIRRHPRAIRVRSDHDAWLRRAAAVTGEPVDVIADRAIGAYRDAIDAPR